MKKRAILSLFLVACLILALFAACSSTEPVSDTPATTPDASTPGTDTPGADEEPVIDYGETDEEPIDIVWQFYDLRMTASDYGDPVWDAVNEILTEKINVTAEIIPVIAADYNNQFNMMVAGGEQVDLVGLTGRLRLADLYANNQVMDITDYLQASAPDCYALVKDYVGALSYDGRIYGVPTLRNFCTNGYICMRKDILDELGLTEKAQNMTTWSEFEEILAAVTEAYAGTGLYAVTKGAQWTIITSESAKLYNGNNFADTIVFDALGDSLGMIYTDNDGHVSNLQATENYHTEISMMRQWYDNGWVYPDSGLVDTHGDELIKQGVAFATIQESEFGVEVVKGAATGYELVCTKYYDGILKTSTLSGWGMAVPITAEEPEAACKVLNLLYTDAELMNLLCWGIEGRDYTVENGEIVQSEDNHYYEADFLIGNNLLLTPLAGNGADFYQQVAAQNEAAALSPYLGFSLDTSGLDLIISQLSAVRDQYRAPMQCGSYTEEGYQDYLEKLAAAGIDDYVASFQQQLDAFLASQG